MSRRLNCESEWSPDLLGLLEQPDVETTLVGVDPPRDSWIACWRAGAPLPGAGADLVLVRPVGDEPRPTETRVVRIDLEDAIAPLLALDGGSRSTVAFAAAARFALTLVAHGRIQPGLTARGIDSWRPGPLTVDDQDHLRHLTEALPAAGHALPSPEGLGPERSAPQPASIVSPGRAVDAFVTAVVDRFVRTAAAPVTAGHDAFAARRSVVIDQRATLGLLATLGRQADQGQVPLITLRLGPSTVPGSLQPFWAQLGLQSRIDASVTVTVEELRGAPQDLRARLGAIENEVSLVLKRAQRIWPPVTALVAEAHPARLDLDVGELEALLGTLGARLGATGLSVIAPRDLFASLDLQPVVSARQDFDEPARVAGRRFAGQGFARPGSAGQGFAGQGFARPGFARPGFAGQGSAGQGFGRGLDLSSLLELRWQGSLAGQQLTEAELAEIIDGKRSIVRLRDQWIRLDPQSLDRLGEHRALPATTAIAAALGLDIDIGGDVQRIEVTGRLSELADRLRQIDSAQQLEPPERLEATLRPYQRRGLAWLDEMDQLGLGGILADDMGLGKTIQIIALHLHRQTRRPGPTLVVCPASVVGNWQREIERFAPGIPVVRYHGSRRNLEEPAPEAIVLTTYGIARRDAHALGAHTWGMVIADEAQAIKNPTSRTSRALRSLKPSTRFALTGTPVQNQLLDLWAILEWTTPGLLGPQERFRQEVVTPIEQHGDPAATERLNRMLRPFLLRRKKSDPDIVPDLPPKTETDEIVPLTLEQVALYQAVVAEVMAEISGATGIGRHGLVLKLVTRLKQVCNHPAHLVPDNQPLARRSGKLDRTVELLEQIRDAGESALVFTQYVAMAHLLVRHLTELGFSVRFLHGGLGIDHRERMVAEFQEGGIDVFVISLRAGGIGLNLTAATQVIHFDRWWNPAVEDQASDRAWRIGQHRPVQVHRLISEGTIEDRIARLLMDKRRLAEAVVGSGESWISQLDDASLAELVALSDDGVDRT